LGFAKRAAGARQPHGETKKNYFPFRPGSITRADVCGGGGGQFNSEGATGLGCGCSSIFQHGVEAVAQIGGRGAVPIAVGTDDVEIDQRSQTAGVLMNEV
jgi:hypothetical protein